MWPRTRQHNAHYRRLRPSGDHAFEHPTLGGQLTIGSIDRTALADDAIASIVQVRQKALAVPKGTGTLTLGRKKAATDAVEMLRLAVLDWPAWR